MACCVFTAYIMSRIIKACELFDVRLLEVKYNDSDLDAYPASGFQPVLDKQRVTTLGAAATVSVAREKQIPGPTERWATVRLLITGMTCSACASTLTHALTSHPSVSRAKISVPLSRATVVFEPRKASTADLISAIEDVGYGAEVLQQGNGGSTQNLRLIQNEEELQALKNAFNGAAKWATVTSVLDWMTKVAIEGQLQRLLVLVSHFGALAIACYVQGTHARWIHRNAWASCYSRRRLQMPNLNMDSLLSLSLSLSIILSFFNIALDGPANSQTKTYFATASFLTVVISGGRYLDVTLKRQGATSFTRLYGLQREIEMGTVMVEGTLRRNGDEAEADICEAVLTPCPSSLLAPLDTYHIPPQSLIPCNSYIIRGSSLIDESNMTGESAPVRKSVGDMLMSGTRNLSAGVVAVVLKEQSESSLEKLVRSIEEATESRCNGAGSGNGSGSGVADVMMRYFVSAVLILTVVGFVATYSLSPHCLPLMGRVNLACERAMAILAAACPCAIGLANPSAIMAGVDAAYFHGMLLPGGAKALENLARLTHLVLDKTGTLTEGKLQISEAFFAEPLSSEPEKMMLCYSLLSAAERDEAQRHPVARTVFQWCVKKLQASSHLLDSTVQAGTSPTRNVSNTTGKGVVAEVQGHDNIWYTVHIGSKRFLSEHDISLAPSTQLATARGGAQVHFAIDGSYAGSFVLQDTIRQNASAVVESLKELGLSLTMLTGDSELEARRVSSQLHIPVLAAKSLPHEKRDLVVALQRASTGGTTNNTVAMLGDGLNDGPAQAAADVGILFSSSPLSSRSSDSASSLAIGTSAADVIVMTSDLAAVPKLITIARKTVAQGRWNTLWAVLYNAIAIALAMGVGQPFGLKSPDASSAGMMMAFSSITVLAMSLHLRQRLI
jgi:heavy metal translocating P-type ATPase